MTDDLLGNASVSAVLGSLFGGVVSLFISRRSENAARIFASYQSVESIIDDLQCVSCSYWKKSGRCSSEEDAIKNLSERLDIKVDSYIRLCKKSSLRDGAEKILDDLSDVVSGGDFEASNRKREFHKTLKIKQLCGDLRDLLHAF